MNQVAFQNVGRHPITDRLLRIRRRFPDRRPHLPQNLLHILREARDVLIDILGFCLAGFHPVSYWVGSVKQSLLPSPSVLSAQIFPP